MRPDLPERQGRWRVMSRDCREVVVERPAHGGRQRFAPASAQTRLALIDEPTHEVSQIVAAAAIDPRFVRSKVVGRFLECRVGGD